MPYGLCTCKRGFSSTNINPTISNQSKSKKPTCATHSITTYFAKRSRLGKLKIADKKMMIIINNGCPTILK